MLIVKALCCCLCYFSEGGTKYLSGLIKIFNPYDGWRYTASDSALCATEAETEQKYVKGANPPPFGAYPLINFAVSRKAGVQGRA